MSLKAQKFLNRLLSTNFRRIKPKMGALNQELLKFKDIDFINHIYKKAL